MFLGFVVLVAFMFAVQLIVLVSIRMILFLVLCLVTRFGCFFVVLVGFGGLIVVCCRGCCLPGVLITFDVPSCWQWLLLCGGLCYCLLVVVDCWLIVGGFGFWFGGGFLVALIVDCLVLLVALRFAVC